MSVVVQDMRTGQIMLLCKGADFSIFERLSSTIEQVFLDSTKEDLIKFSTKGFRTLCFAVRVLDYGFYMDWAQKYESIKISNFRHGLPDNSLFSEETTIIPGQENEHARLQNELESDLFLLGTTALEDKLQEGVPEAIEDF